jgi:ERCC4-related helicase
LIGSDSQSIWLFSTLHNSPCKVIEEQTLWGLSICRIWLPGSDVVVRVPRESLREFTHELHPEIETHRIAYMAAAAKVAEILEGSNSPQGEQVLLAPMESNVIPLPHQINALARAISGDRIRYLLADEVGLGKTIEAGLVMRELKLRGLVRRTLIVAPKGLATQWVSEMRIHFNETVQLVLPSELKSSRVSGSEFLVSNLCPINPEPRTLNPQPIAPNPWQQYDQVVVPLDSVKPLEKRRGWSQERIAEYNRNRFEDLITAGWDLVIVDEAHRLGGSTDLVARYKLGLGLAEAAPYVLLLSATPHQGKTEAFHRLVSLLDADSFPDIESVSRERVAPFVIRTEKRKAIDADGKPLFKPRKTEMAGIQWESRHHLQKLLYESVTEYVREGYNQAKREKKQHVGFLMLLMQRLVISSTQAIKTTLERRLQILRDQRDASENVVQCSLFDTLEGDDCDTSVLFDLDGQELLEEVLKSRISALANETSIVEALLEAARRCERAGADAKTESLIDWIYRLQADENEPDLKILIFTEFVPTQVMLAAFLRDRGISTVCLNGSMGMEERRDVQEQFRKTARVLVSTDAGGEGLNLQFCHVVVNYDLPWNPMRIEQRIGRVDRIGQKKVVRAINLVLEDSVEFHVREVLQHKLAIIFEEFGIDKTGDVLDSARAGELFEDVFAAAVVDPENVDATLEKTVLQMRDEIVDARRNSAIFAVSDEPDIKAAQKLRSHPLPHWIERMVVGYICSRGGTAQHKRSWWELRWPDGEVNPRVVFKSQDAEKISEAIVLNLENRRIRGLAMQLPPAADGQPIPMVKIKDLPEEIKGWWGLYEIRVQSGLAAHARHVRMPSTRKSFLAIFVDENSRVFLPTGRHVWDILQSSEIVVTGTISGADAHHAYTKVLTSAEVSGKDIFDTLCKEYLSAIDHEEKRGRYSLAARKRVIEKIGLAEVRRHRLAKLGIESDEWMAELELARNILPEIKPLLMLHLEGGARE